MQMIQNNLFHVINKNSSVSLSRHIETHLSSVRGLIAR